VWPAPVLHEWLHGDIALCPKRWAGSCGSEGRGQLVLAKASEWGDARPLVLGLPVSLSAGFLFLFLSLSLVSSLACVERASHSHRGVWLGRPGDGRWGGVWLVCATATGKALRLARTRSNYRTPLLAGRPLPALGKRNVAQSLTPSLTYLFTPLLLAVHRNSSSASSPCPFSFSTANTGKSSTDIQPSRIHLARAGIAKPVTTKPTYNVLKYLPFTFLVHRCRIRPLPPPPPPPLPTPPTRPSPHPPSNKS